MSATRTVSSASSLTVKIGNWFEANATGPGVFAVPLVVLVIIVGCLADRML